MHLLPLLGLRVFLQNLFLRLLYKFDLDTKVMRSNNIDSWYSLNDRNISIHISSPYISWDADNEKLKDVFSSCHERGTKKKFWVPMRNRTSDLRICAPMLYHWATKTLRWAKLRSSNDTRPAYCKDQSKSKEQSPRLVTRRKNIFLNLLISYHLYFSVKNEKLFSN